MVFDPRKDYLKKEAVSLLDVIDHFESPVLFRARVSRDVFLLALISSYSDEVLSFGFFFLMGNSLLLALLVLNQVLPISLNGFSALGIETPHFFPLFFAQSVFLQLEGPSLLICHPIYVVANNSSPLRD